MNGQKTWRDFGFSGFMTRAIPSSEKISSIEARNLIPIGGISPSRLVSPLNATTNIVFSSTDNNTAAWASGVLYFADGTNSGTIDAGNTGNISTTSYVYYDKETLGTLQTTIIPANATKYNRLLIAIVEIGASGKDCKITPTIAAGLNVSGITASQITAGTITSNEIATNTIVVGDIDSTVSNRLFTDSTTKTNVEGWKHGSDVTKIDGGDVYTNTITASQIAAGTITATEISGNQLDVVSANTGTLNVDEYITLGSDSNVKIDGTNKRISVSDGTDIRILIGFQSGGF